MKEKKGSRLERFFSFRTLGSKLFLSVVVFCIVIVIAVLIIVSRFNITTVEDLILTKLKTDINYLEDIISGMEESEWHIEDGALYKGEVLIGDGTEENANTAPFYEAESKSGTFVYTFMKCGDEGLEWTGDQKTGYQQGHFIRIAGTTKGPDGQSIVGTYIDKKVSDVLDRDGEYSGAANVAGGQIYCYYKTLKNNAGEVVGVIVAGRSMAALSAAASRATRSIIILVVIIILIVGACIYLLLNRSTKLIENMEDYLQRIGRGELPEDKLELNTKDEIGDVAVSINEMVESLREGRRISGELSVAADIQANLLPKIFPPFPERTDFDLYASMNPAKEVGGDFYDFFMIDSDHLALVIADVSGKGVPAALFMVTAKTLIKDHGMLGMSAGDVFTRANALMCESNDYGLFVTGWLGIIELSTGKVDYVNAGHNPPLISHNGQFEYLKGKHDFVLAGMEGVKYRSQELTLKPGDILYLYTDGVTESTNADKELYGNQRLLDYVNEHIDDGMQELCEGIKAQTDEFKGEAEQFDDITMVAFRFIGGNEEYREIVVDAKIENIPAITAFADAVLDEYGCEMKPKLQIDVALDEIASNIALYAYKGHTGSMKIQIGQLEDKRSVIIRVIDGGMPFDPLQNAAPDITTSAEEREIGGLGVHIVRNTMDSVEYKYENSKNVLVLTKKIKN